MRGIGARELERDAIAEAQRYCAEIRLAGESVLETDILESRFEENPARTNVELAAEKSGKAELGIALAVFQAKRGRRGSEQKDLRLDTNVGVNAFVGKKSIRNGQTNRYRLFDKIPAVRAIV